MYQKISPMYEGQLAQAVKRLSDNAFIPFDPANTDYQAFLKYQAEGGKVYGADEEVPTPADEVTE
jgi:hypothetical protein